MILLAHFRNGRLKPNAKALLMQTTAKTWPLVNEFCWNWVQLTQPLKSIGFGIKVQSVFWSSRRRRLPRTEQEMIWTNQKLPLMIHVLWPGFPFSFSLCSGPMRKDCCFDSAVQEVLCITWEVSDREIAWVVPKPLISGYVFTAKPNHILFDLESCYFRDGFGAQSERTPARKNLLNPDWRIILRLN